MGLFEPIKLEAYCDLIRFTETRVGAREEDEEKSREATDIPSPEKRVQPADGADTDRPDDGADKRKQKTEEEREKEGLKSVPTEEWSRNYGDNHLDLR